MTNRFNDDNLTDTDYELFYRIFPSDEKFFAKLIRDNWELEGPAECDAHPFIYFNTTDASTRENTLGGSIYVYSPSVAYPQIMGISYDSIKQTGSVSIDIQNPNLMMRNRIWTREVLRILNKFRRAGRLKLNGWDYLQVSQVSKRDPNYTNYYHTVIDVKLNRTINDLENSGEGNDNGPCNDSGQSPFVEDDIGVLK